MGIVETWKPIPNHPGYEISDLGRARSIDRWVPYSDGRKAWFKGKLLSPGKVGKGYLQVALGGSCPNNYIHVLVTLTFIGPCPLGKEVAHNDGCTTNNHLSNLRYDTPRGNAEDRLVHGTHGRGVKNSMAKLNEDAVRVIRSKKIPIPELLRRYGVCRGHIHAIRNREAWGWLE